MAATIISSPFPDDQQQQQAEEAVPIPGPPASNNNAWHSSGSIGPFFAVISVLTVLAIISCILGRICRSGRRLTPLESIKNRDCYFGFSWFRRKSCLGSVDGEVLGNKAVEGQNKSNDGSV